MKQSLKQGNYSTVRGDGGGRVGEVQAGTTSPMPEHKGLCDHYTTGMCIASLLYSQSNRKVEMPNQIMLYRNLLTVCFCNHCVLNL